MTAHLCVLGLSGLLYLDRSDVISQRPALHFYEEGLRSLQEPPHIRSVTGKEASSQEVTEQEVVLYSFPGV